MQVGGMRSLGVLVAAVMLLGIAGCGDDAGTVPPDGTGETTVETAPAQPDPGLWCATVFDVDEYVASRDDAETDEEIQALAADILLVWARLVPNAPAEVADDVRVVGEGLQRIAEGDLTAMEDDRYNEAYEGFADFVFDACDYELTG